MARTTTRKPKVAKSVEPEVQPIETPVEVAIEESAAKKEFRAFIEKYKAGNPAKYALREQELLTKLNSLN